MSHIGTLVVWGVGPLYSWLFTGVKGQEDEMLAILEELGLTLIEDEDPRQLAGLMYFTDPKGVDHCVFYARKS